MSYAKQVWEDAPSTSSPITAARLNHMEDGIKSSNDITDTVGSVSNLTTTDKTSVVNAINENTNILSKIGKVLWEGTFTTGSLIVPNINDYSIIAIRTGSLWMIGNQIYGGLVFTAYGQMSHTSYAYRFEYDSTAQKLTTTTNDKGATDGTNQLTINKIIGIV